MKLTITQRPDHVAHIGDTVMVDGDPFVIKELKPIREAGVFLDWNQRIEPNQVIATVERFDGMDS